MNGRRWAVVALAVVIGLPCGSAGAADAAELSGRHLAWLGREVAVLITPAERDAFLKLESDGDRDLFIEEFWRQRDPTPGTPANEFRDEHARRLVYADEHFGGGGAPVGRLTDRGRTLVRLGPPLDVQIFRTPDICPVEIWYYLRDLRAEGPLLVRLLFFQEYGADEFKLYDPLADGPKRLVPFPEKWKDEGAGGPAFPAEWTAADAKAYRILIAAVTGELAEATLSSFPGSTAPGDAARSAALIAELEQAPRRRVKDDYAVGVPGRPASGPVNYALHPMEMRSAASVLKDAAGRIAVSYVLAPDILALDSLQGRFFAGLRTRIKATDASGRTAFQAETFRSMETAREEVRALAQSPFEVYGAFPLGPGTYEVDVVLENTVSKDFGSASFKVEIPAAPGPWMGPLVLSRNAVRDDAGTAIRPFRAGPIQLYPSVDGVFMAKDALFVFLQADGLGPAPAASVEYAVLAGGKILKSARRAVGAGAGRLDLLEEIPLEGLAPGDFLVKAALLDADGREILARTAPFTVTAKFVPGRWVFALDPP